MHIIIVPRYRGDCFTGNIIQTYYNDRKIVLIALQNLLHMHHILYSKVCAFILFDHIKKKKIKNLDT